MSQQQHQPGELALVKAVRSLDQGGSTTTPDKLDQIWKILSIYSGGKFHAAEEMLVRWLLKNMNGSSDDAQRIRRYPLTWRILGKVFTSIPLFSLAKSLADRRFVPILQTTLKDASEPKEAVGQKQSSDTEMVDADSEPARPRKKTRSDTIQFDLESQSGTFGCLRTAEALFEAIRLILTRLESSAPTSAKRDNHMGAEHIKSLFCSSATDMKDLVLPALKACKLAVDRADNRELYDGQETWISTICTLWDLHLQGEADALQVATFLSPPAIAMLGKLTDVSPKLRSMDSEVQSRWAEDLKRFLTRNLILPARTAFLNQESTEFISVTVDMTAAFSTLSCPVIYDLVLESPQLAGGQGVKRSNDSWIQVVFSLLGERLRSSKSQDTLVAVEHMMNKTYENGVSLSLESLRSCCEIHALQASQVEWPLLVLIVKINPDAFIIGDGEALLQAVIDRINSPGVLEGVALDEAIKFIIALAAGFANARDLAGFVKKWYSCLTAAEPQNKAHTRQYLLWFSEKLVTAVAESLERTMNTKQILSLLDWLETQGDGPADHATLVLLFGALSQGISREEVIDAVGTRLFDTISKKKLPDTANSEVLANRWTVARRSLQWSTLGQAEDIWAGSVTNLTDDLAKATVTQPHLVEAFKFAIAGWIVNHPGGKYENDAAELTFSFMSWLDQEENLDGAMRNLIVNYLVDGRHGCPQVFSMIVQRGEDQFPRLLKRGLSFVDLDDGSRNPGAIQRLKALFTNEVNTNNRATMDLLLKLICADMGDCESKPDTSVQGATTLLDVPLEAIPREHREKLMTLLAAAAKSYALVGGSEISRLSTVTGILDLMVKLMRKPTFYTDMAFSDIDSVAKAIATSTVGSDRSSLEYLPLVEELATLTARQMTANMEKREKDYLSTAVATVEEFEGKEDLTGFVVFRIVMLKALIVSINGHHLEGSPPKFNADGLDSQMTALVQAVVGKFAMEWKKTKDVASLLQAASAVINAADGLEQWPFTEKLHRQLTQMIIDPYLPQFREACETLRLREDLDVWSLQRYIARRADLITSQALLDLGNTPGLDGDQLIHKHGILEYVDAVVGDKVDDVDCMTRLLVEQPEAPNRVAKLLAVHRMIQKVEGNASATGQDLAKIHTLLCKGLRHAETPAEFVLITEIIQTLLDDRSHAMTQWNIELTLSTVSTLASQASTHNIISSTPKAYGCLCRLVQVIVRRHRLRIEGHFHLLITVLQSLLRSLICHPYGTSGKAWSTGLIKDSSAFPRWEKHAKAFGRLLTMVCEPTPGSVSRSQQNSLDSATDAAKRYAGQHMYLVLMMYIKLQLEQNVPHDVREALEPGVFAILDITTPEGRRIMNDALDGSGRAIMKELYKQYLKFGKWSGI